MKHLIMLMLSLTLGALAQEATPPLAPAATSTEATAPTPEPVTTTPAPVAVQPAPATVPEAQPTVASTTVDSLTPKKTGWGAGLIGGISFLDMREEKKILKNDLDTLFPTTVHGFDDTLNNLEAAPSWGVLGYYQFENGLRIGGSFTSNWRMWTSEAIADTLVNFVYTNSYGGFLVEGRTGNETNSFIYGVTLGGGASTMSFVKTADNDDIWWSEDDFDNNSKTAVAGFFMSEIHLGYMHSFSRIFHMGFDANGVFQASPYGYGQDYNTNDRFSSFSPGMHLRFIWGTKG